MTTEHHINNLNELIEEKNPRVARFLAAFDNAIITADDVIDHKIKTLGTMIVLENLHQCCLILAEEPALYFAIAPHYGSLLAGEYEDIQFTPGRNPQDMEIEVWKMRGNRASIAFACLCYVEPSFDTEENWAWVKDVQTKGLIRNDCDDIISGMFEDFVQTRRNYVALKYYDSTIYFTWRDRIGELKEKAKEVEKDLEITEPKDKRLYGFYKVMKGD